MSLLKGDVFVAFLIDLLLLHTQDRGGTGVHIKDLDLLILKYLFIAHYREHSEMEFWKKGIKIYCYNF